MTIDPDVGTTPKGPGGRPRREPEDPPIPELLPLHVARLALGVTTREIARRSGLPLGTISGFFSGKVPNPSTRTTIEIARALGLALSWAEDEDGEASR
jgi:hypothetical protein